MRAIVFTLAVTLTARSAVAQLDAPGPSPTEQRVQSLNRSMLNEQQSRAATQQNQFEVNSLRNELSRTVVPPPVVGSPIR